MTINSQPQTNNEEQVIAPDQENNVFDKFTVKMSPSISISSHDKLIFDVNGSFHKLWIKNGKDDTADVLLSSAGSKPNRGIVLYSGTPYGARLYFQILSEDILNAGVPIGFGRKLTAKGLKNLNIIASVGAIVICALAVFASIHSKAPTAINPIKESAGLVVEHAPDESEERARRMQRMLLDTTAPPQINAAQPTGQVAERPSFLKLPEERTDTQTVSTVAQAELPDYSPDLYAPTASSKGTQPSGITQAAPNAPTAPSKATEPSGITQAAPSANQSQGSAEPPVAPAQIPSAANVSDQLTAEQASKIAMSIPPSKMGEVLTAIDELMDVADGKITPEMIDGLPHDVAQLLKEAGLLGANEGFEEQGDAPYALIRLPQSVIDAHRGKDGIASIPENGSHASMGNKIPMTLPGGGDIRKPEDLLGFGFTP